MNTLAINRSQAKEQGFTLVEFVIYVAIFSIIALAIMSFSSAILKPKAKTMVVTEVDQQGNQYLQILTQTIRNAELVNSPGKGVSASSLSLDVVNVSNDPTIFDVNSGILQIKEGAALAVPLTTDRVTVSNLTFKNLTKKRGFGSVRINFTITYNNTSGAPEYSYQKDFYATADLR